MQKQMNRNGFKRLSQILPSVLRTQFSPLFSPLRTELQELSCGVKIQFSLTLRIILIQTLWVLFLLLFPSLSFFFFFNYIVLESVQDPEMFSVLVTITCTVKLFFVHCQHRFFCTYLFICVYKCQLVLYLSFLSPSFVILINFLLERLYIFFSKYFVKQFSIAISLNMMNKSDCECKLKLVVRSYYG